MGKQKRECAVCGRDLYRKWAWADWKPGTRQAKHICMACGPQGWRFNDDGTVYNRHEMTAIVSPWNVKAE
jgi:hypothetical protein